jgi:thiol-disulfide isomerase/thioredoxin
MVLLIIVLLLLFVHTNNVFAQKRFETSVIFTKEVDTKDIIINYYDGIDRHEIKAILKDNKIKFSGIYYTEYCEISIINKVKKAPYYYGQEFFVQTKPSEIVIDYQKEDTNINPLKYTSLINAVEIKKVKEIVELNEYFKKEKTDYEDFFKIHKYDSESDSLKANLDKLLFKQKRKALEFIKGKEDSYMSFWIFKNYIMYNLADESPILALNSFNTLFPKKFTNTGEGKKMLAYLKGRMYAKEGNKTPNFITKDIKNNIVVLDKLRGKYVLLVFWATWCVPCVAEIPTIKEIRKKYPNTKLEILGIGNSSDRKKYEDFIKKNKMNWTHLINNDIANKYGDVTLPSLFLINDKGIIIYNSMENNLDISKLKLLLTALD